jgi:hypothetical protein
VEKVKCSVLLTKYHSADEIIKNEMVRACGTYGGQAKCIQDFGGEIWGKGTT